MFNVLFKNAFGKRNIVVYPLVLALLVAVGLCYSSRAKKQFLNQPLTKMRGLLLSNGERIQLRNERATLSFQLDALPLHFPELTNRISLDRWESAAATAVLDPQLCRKWRAYQRRVSMLVVQKDSQLAFFSTLQEAYGNDVEKLAFDWTATNKQQSLFALRTNKFAALFTNTTYLPDQRQWEKIAQGLQDADTAALRTLYLEGLADSVTNTEPQLAGYPIQLLEMNQESASITKRLAELDDKLGDGAEVAQTGGTLTIPNPVRRLIAAANFSFSDSSGKDLATLEAATAVILILLTWPIELREHRWKKILVSLVLVYFALLTLRYRVHLNIEDKGEDVFPFLAYLIPGALFAAIWTSTFAELLANGMTALIHSSGSATTDSGNLNEAYSLANKQDFAQALAVARTCLRDDPHSFEALALAAKLHRKLNHRWRALVTLKKIRRQRNLSGSQRDYLDELSRNFKNPAANCWNVGLAKSGRSKSEIFLKES